ncbi:MAG TPA: putative toxin-antitoxin system toxin component, PIN family [Terriglobales bacterium]|nr:putative toxin-antitoxin system toxin component, PIN family [Terriglobales bacterium]
MAITDRVVVDTNVLVSRLLLPQSIPAQAVRRALDSTLLFSEATMNELADVLSRAKFDPYIARRDREQFVRELCTIGEFVPIIQLVRDCPDPSDNKFLEVALNGRADPILTGDADLLALHPWRKIAIVTPAEYLKR